MQAINKRGDGTFSEADVGMCKAMCALFSCSILNAHVFEREKSSRIQKEALLELSQVISSKLELQSLLLSAAHGLASREHG